MQTQDSVKASAGGGVKASASLPMVAPPRAPQSPPEQSVGIPQQAMVPVVVVPPPDQGGVGAKEWLEFGQAFAWPLLILALALTFRKQVAQKIENMATFKTPVAESTWNAQAATAAYVAEAIVEAEAAPEEVEVPAQAAPEETVEVQVGPAPDLHRYSPFEPDFTNAEAVGSVLVMWQVLEKSVKDLVASRNVSTRDFSLALRWLQRSKIVPPTTIDLIHQLRILRNDVVHLRGARVDSDSYRRSVLAVVETLEHARRRPQPPAVEK